MRLLQHNCRKTYAVTIAALEAGLKLGVGLACLQEPYIDMGIPTWTIPEMGLANAE